MIRFARLTLCAAVLAAPAFLFGCSEEAPKTDTPATTPPPAAASTEPGKETPKETPKETAPAAPKEAPK
jgi:hypothetical protein